MLLLTMGTYAVYTSAFEVPPPGAGVVTVTFPVPGKSNCEAGMVAVKEVELEYVVATT
jgi:hypothetical protein